MNVGSDRADPHRESPIRGKAIRGKAIRGKAIRGKAIRGKAIREIEAAVRSSVVRESRFCGASNRRPGAATRRSSCWQAAAVPSRDRGQGAVHNALR